MELDDLAAAFTGVKMNGRGFKARCPAHDDHDPSLTVIRGETSWLVTCHVGCQFLDIVSAAGLSPLAFKFGGTSSSTSSRIGSPFDARRKLAELIRGTRRIPYRLIDIARLTLELPDEKVVDITAWYPTLAFLPLRDALKMHHVVMDTVVWDMLDGDWSGYGTDWFEAKGRIEELLWRTYRKERGDLAQR